MYFSGFLRVRYYNVTLDRNECCVISLTVITSKKHVCKRSNGKASGCTTECIH
uniref:Uncharacterized protein n=1 Tax=Babesia bovis TaxID=5865 RepID=S6C8M8_BABBO|nr:hypothetical protein [Babesia bovis]